MSKLRLFNKLAIDLGTSRIRIWQEPEKLLVDQASWIAYDQWSHKVLAVGNQAQAMQKRVGEQIVVTNPFIAGSVSDLNLARMLLDNLLVESVSRGILTNSVIVSFPRYLSSLDQELIAELMRSLGFVDISLIAQPLASIIGAGVPVAEASGAFIMQLGAGVVEVATVSLGSIVAYESTTEAGSWLIGQIQQQLKKQHQIIISTDDAEKLLATVASLTNFEYSQQFAVVGKSLLDGAPIELLVNAPMLTAVVNLAGENYYQLVKKLLAKVPPELTTDIIDKGLLLAGGLAQLQGLEEWLVKRLGVPVAVVDQPDKTTIHGMGTVLANLSQFKQSIGYYQSTHDGI